ncbi:MAG TPA: GNAT family N-acetyltransferase [Candidatus Polarisedimenticolia bacterium]|jgi:amino-acid N-acetyltransferase
MTIEPARAGDRGAVEELLTLCGLPLEGVGDQFARFLVARVPARRGGTEIVGCAGLEAYGAACVLRSLAVAPGARGLGTGRALFTAVIDEARRAGCAEIYLLTYTIERMAARMGFSPIAREDVPPEARASREFAINACDSAAVMRLPLRPARADLSDQSTS